MITFFAGKLAFPVEMGHVFFIRGKTTEDAQRLDVNLSMGKGDEGGIPLHLSTRFDEGIIVRNTLFQDGGWGNEERDEWLIKSDNPMPIVPGEEFSFYIFVATDRFLIAVNKEDYCVYNFRGQLEDIQSITINKDVEKIFQVDHRHVFPFLWPRIQSRDCGLVFKSDVPENFKPGTLIIITAVPYGNPEGTFSIRLSDVDNLRKNYIFFNARFNQQVVFRSITNDSGEFQFPEQHGHFPFEHSSQFKLVIGLAENSFKFAINGESYAEYFFRQPESFDRMTGPRIYCGNGLNLEVTSVDYVETSPDCEHFENYSSADVTVG